MFIVNSYQFASVAPASLLLDLYPATAAYSLRKLRTAYSGSAIRVRRSSDNAEQDIGFVGNDLDTASLLTFVGANDGFVTTWYDQSLNSFNTSQSTSISQPRIVNSGVLETQNGLPSIYTSGNKNLNSGLVTLGVSGDVNVDFFSVLNNQSTGNSNHLFGIGDNSALIDRRKIFAFANDTASTKSVRLIGGNIVYSNSQTGQLLFNTNYQGGGGAFNSRINGVDLSVNSFSNAGLNIQNSSGFVLFSGNSAGSFPITDINPNSIGFIQENIFYLSNESANRTAIETNINDYYGIY